MNETLTKNVAPDISHATIEEIAVDAHYCVGVTGVTAKGAGNYTLEFLPADSNGS